MGLNTSGPTVASEVTTRSFVAVILASLGILAYLAYAFRKVKRPWRYGLCAIFAMIHDVLVVLGIFAILGYFFGVEIDAMFVTAPSTGPTPTLDLDVAADQLWHRFAPGVEVDAALVRRLPSVCASQRLQACW